MTDPCFPGTTAPAELSYFSSIISMFLCIVITVGNFAIILVMYRDPLRKLRNPFAFFLANAAVSDFVVGAFAMPISVIFHLLEANNQINETYIYMLHLSYFISASASLVSIAAMAVDRYVAVISITAACRKLSRRHCLALSTMIWLLAIGFSGFYFLAGFVTLLFIFVIFSLVTSFGVTLLTYIRVLSRMRKTSKALKSRGGTVKLNKEDRAVLREKKVTSAFMALLFSFMGIYLPTFILINLLQFCLTCSCKSRHVFRDLVFLLVSAASATNPIVCLSKMPVLRKSLSAVVKCKRRSAVSQSSSEMQNVPQVGKGRWNTSHFVRAVNFIARSSFDKKLDRERSNLEICRVFLGLFQNTMHKWVAT